MNCIFIGFGYFISRPYLWIAPLFAALLSFCILLAAFLITAYFSWPDSTIGWFSYAWGIFKSLGYGSLIVLALWVTIFPIVLNLAFEQMIGKILHDKRIPIRGEGTFKAITSSIQILFRTLGWRLFWPLLTLITLFFFGPLSLIFAQIGLGHIAIIDACDLSLTLQGESLSFRLQALKARTFPLLIAGCIAGILSMLLTTTLIGWLFWLPSVYVGATLWTLQWLKKFL